MKRYNLDVTIWLKNKKHNNWFFFFILTIKYKFNYSTPLRLSFVAKLFKMGNLRNK